MTSHQGVLVPNRPRTPKPPDHQLLSVPPSPRRGKAGEADRRRRSEILTGFNTLL